jgi:CO/xanthine dehydrogenase FAD-binding subunit
VKPAPFRYERPESVEEALAVLDEHGDDAKVLSGGQSLMPALNMRLVRPGVLVDINRVCDLDNVAVDNRAVRVGATVRQADSRLLELPLLAECLPHVGHLATRNRGTVAGSVAHADPAAELALALVVAGGSVRARSAQGEREIPAADFFVGHFTTQLRPSELLVETVWPRPASGWGYAFEEFAQRRGDFALCMAAAGVRIEGGRVAESRVGVGSVVDRPTLLAVDPERAGESAAAQLDPLGNLHASADYLRHLARVLVDRAVARAAEAAS